MRDAGGGGARFRRRTNEDTPAVAVRPLLDHPASSSFTVGRVSQTRSLASTSSSIVIPISTSCCRCVSSDVVAVERRCAC